MLSVHDAGRFQHVCRNVTRMDFILSSDMR